MYHQPIVLIAPGLRKQPTFWDATTGFPTKWCLRNQCRNLGSDMSSVRNFCACFSKVSLHGNHWRCRQMSAVFSGLVFLNIFFPLIINIQTKDVEHMYFNTFLYSLTVSIFFSLVFTTVDALVSGHPWGAKQVSIIYSSHSWEFKNTEFVFVKVAGSRAVRLGLRVPVRRVSTIVIIGNPCSF